MKAIELSEYVIAYFDNVGDLITNKKLQKLLYYIKAWGIIYFPEEGIIDDDFEAWIHGPVCKDVYQKYKTFVYSPLKIEYEKGISSSEFLNDFKLKNKESQDKFELIDTVLTKYGVLSSLELELLSHSEEPWIEARGECKPIDNCSNIISEKSIKDFFIKKI